MLYNFEEICYDNGNFEEEKEVAFWQGKREKNTKFSLQMILK